MEPITRRGALQLGLLGTASIVVGAVGLSWTTSQRSSPRGAGATSAPSGTWREPTVLRSREGVLAVALDVAESTLELGGRPARVLTYGGELPGPTWRVRPGDRIDVALTNRLTAPTNLHFHGLRVSPAANGDNPFVSLEPGQTFDYSVTLAPDHPTGTAWYHPHLHGRVADQLFAGLYGAIVVEDDDVPVTRDRVLVVSDISLDADGDVRPVSRPERMAGREGALLLVNGTATPTLTARPGEVERWRVVNACTSRFLDLTVEGHRARLLAVDLGHGAALPDLSSVLLAPGNRADLLVTIGSGPGRLLSLGYDRGTAMMGMMRGALGDLSGPATLATVTGTGEAAAPDAREPTLRDLADLRGRSPDHRRELSFTMGTGGMGMGGMTFGFDGRRFDHGRVDQQVGAGTVEEWVIRNPTPMDHPFHLHVWPMQVVDDDHGQPQEPRWRDVVNVPAESQVTVLVDFADHTGRSVYHCHILDHEDLGMMGVVDVA